MQAIITGSGPCEANACFAQASKSVKVPLSGGGYITVLVCADCDHKIFGKKGAGATGLPEQPSLPAAKQGELR